MGRCAQTLNSVVEVLRLKTGGVSGARYQTSHYQTGGCLIANAANFPDLEPERLNPK